jgi:hypothetical protein
MILASRVRGLSCFLVALALAGVVWLVAAHAFESELWPGEGVPRFAAKTDRLVLHREPDISSPVVARQAVEPGQEIAYDRTRFRTIDEGLVIAREPGRLLGRSLGDVEHLSESAYYGADPTLEEIPYAEGEAFAYLQYRAEGTCMIRHDGAVFEIDGCPWEGAPPQGGDFDLARRPVTQWWIEVTAQGRALGWLQVDAQTVDPLPRRF